MMESSYTLRFVVLDHTGISSPHFDLLFETAPNSTLFGVRLNRWPIAIDTVIEVSSVHRRLYLTYEGDLSNGRGSVRRVAEGRCCVETQTDKLHVVLDSGGKFSVPITR